MNGLLGGGCADEHKEAERLRSALAMEEAKNYANKVAKEAYEARSGMLKDIDKELIALRQKATVAETEMKCRDAFLEEHDKRHDLELKLAIRDAVDPLRLDVQRNKDSIIMLDERTRGAIEAERQARCCADNTIVDYVNCTFYPKAIADVKTTDKTTPQCTRNPLPCCQGGGCCR